MFYYNVMIMFNSKTKFKEIKKLLEYLKKTDYKKNHVTKQAIRNVLQAEYDNNNNIKDDDYIVVSVDVLKAYHLTKEDIIDLNLNSEITKQYYEKEENKKNE